MKNTEVKRKIEGKNTRQNAMSVIWQNQEVKRTPDALKHRVIHRPGPRKD